MRFVPLLPHSRPSEPAIAFVAGVIFGAGCVAFGVRRRRSHHARRHAAAAEPERERERQREPEGSEVARSAEGTVSPIDFGGDGNVSQAV